jgi:hypothetical protein
LITDAFLYVTSSIRREQRGSRHHYFSILRIGSLSKEHKARGIALYTLAKTNCVYD